MKGSKVKEHVCPACGGTGYPVVKQPVQPGRTKMNKLSAVRPNIVPRGLCDQ
jgi:hypothetical protein